MTKNEDISNPFEVTERKTLAVQNIVDKNKYLTILFKKNKTINHGLLQTNKYNDFVLSWRNNATTSRHQRRQCVGRRRIRDGVPSLESRAFYR